MQKQTIVVQSHIEENVLLRQSLASLKSQTESMLNGWLSTSQRQVDDRLQHLCAKLAEVGSKSLKVSAIQHGRRENL